MQALQNRLYEVGIYGRLSKEDMKAESNTSRPVTASISIENQVSILTDYAKEQGWIIQQVYTDDGYSGGNFERPAFQRMIEDAKDGRINLILVKDLSRFGRDSVGVGYYTDEVLPEIGCRFIALSDGIDSEQADSDMLPLLSLLGDFYLKDISRKIKSVLRSKAENGECLMAYVPYGYQKSAADKHRLEIDEYAAEVVRKIYSLRLQRNGFAAIARQLNSEDILPPRTYWNLKNGKENAKGACNLWRDTMVKIILHNDVYLGHLTQMKTGSLTYKDKTMIKKDEDEWIRHENIHEAIIDQSTWDAVQAIDLRKSTKAAAPKTSLFSSMLICADCGSKLTCNTESQHRKNGTVVKYHSYHCPLYYQTGRATCSSHTIYEMGLIELIRTDIEKHAQKVHCDEKQVQAELKKRLCTNLPDVKALEQEIAELRNRLTGLDAKFAMLYEDKVLRKISESSFATLMSGYSQERQQTEQRLAELEKKLAGIQKKFLDISKWTKLIRDCLGLKNIDRALLEELIDHIEIGERKVIDGIKQQDIKIVYKFVGSLEE